MDVPLLLEECNDSGHQTLIDVTLRCDTISMSVPDDLEEYGSQNLTKVNGA